MIRLHRLPSFIINNQPSILFVMNHHLSWLMCIYLYAGISWILPRCQPLSHLCHSTFASSLGHFSDVTPCHLLFTIKFQASSFSRQPLKRRSCEICRVRIKLSNCPIQSGNSIFAELQTPCCDTDARHCKTQTSSSSIFKSSTSCQRNFQKQLRQQDLLQLSYLSSGAWSTSSVAAWQIQLWGRLTQSCDAPHSAAVVPPGH